MQKRSTLHEPERRGARRSQCVMGRGKQCGNRTRLERVSSPKVNPRPTMSSGRADKKIPKFEDWNELKFVVLLRRKDYL